MLNKKGYNLIMWVILLSLISVVMIATQVPLKKAVQRNVIRSADFWLWKFWGEAPKQEKGEEGISSKSMSNVRQKQDISTEENSSASGMKITYSMKNPEPIMEKSATYSVDEEAGARLQVADTNLNDSRIQDAITLPAEKASESD